MSWSKAGVRWSRCRMVCSCLAHEDAWTCLAPCVCCGLFSVAECTRGGSHASAAVIHVVRAGTKKLLIFCIRTAFKTWKRKDSNQVGQLLYRPEFFWPVQGATGTTPSIPYHAIHTPKHTRTRENSRAHSRVMENPKNASKPQRSFSLRNSFSSGFPRGV